MFEEILSLAKQRNLEQGLLQVIDDCINSAWISNKEERGLRLAAAFDLLVSIEYYNNIANRGWVYCNRSPQMIFYPYTNICPRCIGYNDFQYAKSNKPESARIGMITTDILCEMLERIFIKQNKNIKVFKASEPIDVIIFDKDANKIIISEVKSAPMITMPLAMYSEQLTDTLSGELVYAEHCIIDNPLIKKSNIGLFFPKAKGLNEKIINLNINWKEKFPIYTAFHNILINDKLFFNKYFEYWIKAYDSYSKKCKELSLYWLTNGCGQPIPRPNNWPARKGTGYESVSDGKTSVGMDRTDDIKKAIYQVLKIGAEYKKHNSNIKTAIISNIHAVRHYDDYLLTVKDIIWTFCDKNIAYYAKDLDPNTPMYNLFDGIISFTSSNIRDTWMKNIFTFGEIK